MSEPATEEVVENPQLQQEGPFSFFIEHSQPFVSADTERIPSQVHVVCVGSSVLTFRLQELLGRNL